MKSTWIQRTTVISLILLSACSQASSFDAGIETKGLTQDATPVDGGNAVPAPPVVVEEKKDPVIIAGGGIVEVASIASIVVQVPSESLRAGSQKIQALATITGTNEKDVTWTVTGPAGITDPLKVGTIDAAGVYLSPADDSIGIAVTITAALVSDPTVSGSTGLQLIPAKQLFVGCKKGSDVFPITGEIYDGLNRSILRIPDFSTMKSNEKICLDKFNIVKQPGIAGFMGQPDRKEWFGLHTVSTLIVPVDGEYEFTLDSDDGSVMTLGEGTMAKPFVLDHGEHHVMTQLSGKVMLKAGKHKLILDWYQGNIGYLGLIVSWKKPGAAASEVIPTTSFAAEVSVKE